MKALISLLKKTAKRQRSSSSSTRFRAATQDKFRFRSRAHGARERGRAAGVRLQYDVVRMYCNSMHLRTPSRCLNAWICISVRLGCVLCNFVEKRFGAMSHFEPTVNLMFAYRSPNSPDLSSYPAADSADLQPGVGPELLRGALLDW